MSGDVLAVDVGTSAMKVGVFSPDLEERASSHRAYEPHLYRQGWADIDPELWWAALRECCVELGGYMDDVGVVALSVTTPGLTAMAEDGRALAPAILFLDGRSREQARDIRRIVGEDVFLREACNLPVSGGSSLASILWLRDNRRDVWDRTAVFGHCNSWLVRRLTGRWAIDPSTTSITGLYNTALDDLSWNERVLEAAGIPAGRLPPLVRSHAPVGSILPGPASELGLPPDAVVLCGANDAVLAALSGGLTEPGDVNIISGTCDIASVCTARPLASPAFNVRCHVLPGRWLTFFVLNAGGEALAWFRRVACADLDDEQFYGEFVPAALTGLLADSGEREATLPRYVPFLGGSRYSLERRTGVFDGLTLETTREDLLLAIVRGNLEYLGEHLREVSQLVRVNRTVGISGGAARIPGMLEARRRWTGAFEYVYRDQSSLVGAAMLGRMYLSGKAAPSGAAERKAEAMSWVR